MSNFFVPAYLQVKHPTETRYREVFGLDFEDFHIGQMFDHRPGMTVTQQDNAEEALDTLNSAQLHYDQHYASQTEWKQCLVVSTLTSAVAIGAGWKTFYKKRRILRFHSIKLTHPVFGGDTLYARSTIQALKDSGDARLGVVTVQTEAFNQHHDSLGQLTYDIEIYKKGSCPFLAEKPNEILQVVEEPRFSAYKQGDQNQWIEQVGLFFDDFNTGEIFEHRPSRTITKADNLRHSIHALNWHPYYVNELFADRYSEGEPYLNEFYALTGATSSSTRTFGRVVANLSWENIEFHQPMRADQTFVAESVIVGKRESHSRPDQGIVELKTFGYNEQGALVLSFDRHLLVYKRNTTVYNKAEY